MLTLTDPDDLSKIRRRRLPLPATKKRCPGTAAPASYPSKQDSACDTHFKILHRNTVLPRSLPNCTERHTPISLSLISFFCNYLVASAPSLFGGPPFNNEGAQRTGVHTRDQHVEAVECLLVRASPQATTKEPYRLLNWLVCSL